ncbi:AAA family ATPase [Xylanimonas allomyrinae]|uniref:AAA family ATPase n=1 Tax=Xylanimonas allomyrinae TaxID=2509459 RepID=UPI001FE65847|nr:AAA family ATPase [Xylanimonas allomyrinae]
MTLVDFPLPGAVEIGRVLDGIVEANRSGRIVVDLDAAGREGLVVAALGLTVNEASNAFAKAMVADGRLTTEDAEVVLAEKRSVVRKAGLLEFVDADAGLMDVGGMSDLKCWFEKRDGLWLQEARAFGVPPPKGVLITGVPGCGKSLTAKAVAGVWGLPLLRLDVGRVFGGLMGSSEANMRAVLRTAEAVAPCIVWVDEIDKGFAGLASGGDSGTTARVFGSFLTWMAEKTAPVFVIATANRADRLPPELVRKGRFDEVFFVDLPTAVEREEIWAVRLRARLEGSRAGGAVQVDQGLCTRLAAASEGFSGAEIEQSVATALVEAFADRRQLLEADLFRAVDAMVPVSVTQADEVAQVRSWASTHAVPATAPQDRVAPLGGLPGAGPGGPLGTDGNVDGFPKSGWQKGELN